MKLASCLLLALCWLPFSALHAQTVASLSRLAAARPTATSASASRPDQSAPSASQLLTGTVLNDNEEPVPGAVVTVLTEPTNSASTNSAGLFILRSSAVKPILQVKCAGYIDSEQPGNYTKPVVFKLTTVPDYERQLKKRGKAVEKAYKKVQ